MKKDGRGRENFRTDKLETIVLEDTNNDEDTDGRKAREVKRRNEENDVEKIRAKDVNGRHDRGGGEKRGSDDGNEKGNQEQGDGTTLRKSTAVHVEVEGHLWMKEKVHNAQVWTTEDKDDESRKVETDGNLSNVFIHVAETLESDVTEDGLKCTNTMQLPTGDDMGVHTSVLTPLLQRMLKHMWLRREAKQRSSVQGVGGGLHVVRGRKSFCLCDPLRRVCICGNRVVTRLVKKGVEGCELTRRVEEETTFL